MNVLFHDVPESIDNTLEIYDKIETLTLARDVLLPNFPMPAGFDTQGVDGRIGPKTLEAVRGFQRAQGMTPDGYASLELLKELR